VQGPDALAARLIDALAKAPFGPGGAAWIDALMTHGVAHQISDRTERTVGYMQAQVPHTEIASRILDALDPNTPLVVIGLGRNGRTLVEAAAAAGFSCTVFDDRPVD